MNLRQTLAIRAHVVLMQFVKNIMEPALVSVYRNTLAIHILAVDQNVL